MQPARRALAAAAAVVVVGSLAAGSGALGHVAELMTGLQQAAGQAPVPFGLAVPASVSATPSPTRQPSAVDSPPAVVVPSIDLTPAPVPSLPSSATPVPSVEASAAPPPPTVRRYVVQSGDTLAGIAQQFGVSIQAVQQANGIADQNVISVGQVLVIP